MIIADWDTLKERVKKRACELIRTGEYHEGQPVRVLLVRCLADVTRLAEADIRRQLEALPSFLMAPIEAEITLLYQRCAQVVPPPKPPETNTDAADDGPGAGKVAGGVLLLIALVWGLTRKKGR